MRIVLQRPMTRMPEDMTIRASASPRNSADLEHSQNPIDFRTGCDLHAYISITQCCCCVAQNSEQIDTLQHNGPLSPPTNSNHSTGTMSTLNQKSIKSFFQAPKRP